MKPFTVRDVTSPLGRTRMLIDLQLLGISRSLKFWLSRNKPIFLGPEGRVMTHGVVLDLGCGEQPFRKMLSKTHRYVGIDIASGFDMSHPSSGIILYDGISLPLRSDSVNLVVTTEVFEHVRDLSKLLREVARVLTSEGSVFVTMPWSARVHYSPNDYRRLTPYGIQVEAESVGLKLVCHESRGNLLSVISNKLNVWLLGKIRAHSVWIVIALLLSPLFVLVSLLGLLATLRGTPSDDPLGYTFVLSKNGPANLLT